MMDGREVTRNGNNCLPTLKRRLQGGPTGYCHNKLHFRAPWSEEALTEEKTDLRDGRVVETSFELKCERDMIGKRRPTYESGLWVGSDVAGPVRFRFTL